MINRFQLPVRDLDVAQYDAPYGCHAMISRHGVGSDFLSWDDT